MTAPQPAQIRRATVADAEGIAQVHVDAWRAAYRGLLPQDLLDGLDVRRRAEQWQPRVAVDHVQVAVVDERVVGFVVTGPSRDDGAAGGTGEVIAVNLAPEHWGAGVGRSLLAAAVRVLTPEFIEATLWVLDGNTRAIRFYERQGWHPDGTTKTVALGGASVVEIRYQRSW